MAFFWEDYASSKRGVEITLNWRGHKLPFSIKRTLTLDERQAANQAAIEIGLDKNGKPEIKRQDQAAYTKEIVRVGVLSWPFEYVEGSPVPINAKNIASLDGSLLDELASHILGTVEVDKKATTPFEKKSEEDSSQEEQPDQN